MADACVRCGMRDVAGDIRARIQDELVDMLGKRRSVWLG